MLAALLLILLVLQYRLWIAEGGLSEQARLKRQVAEQTRINEELRLTSCPFSSKKLKNTARTSSLVTHCSTYRTSMPLVTIYSHLILV